MRKRLALVVSIYLVGSACLGGGGGQTRNILVDYSHDEFASFFAFNFPEEVTVAAGDTVVFKQTWTGEPHTVTGGKIADGVLRKGKQWLRFFEAFDGLRAQGVKLPDPEDPPDVAFADVLRLVERSKKTTLREQFLDSYDRLVAQGAPFPPRGKPGAVGFPKVVEDVDKTTNELFDALPFAFGEEEEGIAQNVGQRCFLTKGAPPKDPNKPCAKNRQQQPEFNGNANFYNSGIIPYQGAQGNTFTVKLSRDIKPGSYFFYCAVHGPGQSSEIKVRPRGAKVPSQTEVSRRAQQQIGDIAKPMLEIFRDAQDGTIDIDGERVKGPFAGLGAEEVHGSINEFVPKTIRTNVGEKVTWKITGADHSITFDVPKYFPIIRFAKNGTISLNPKLDQPAGGSPKIPEGKEGEILRVDGGTYDGSGYFSSSVFGGGPYAEYSLRFSRAGTYKYACLIHPPMVGTVVVTR